MKFTAIHRASALRPAVRQITVLPPLACIVFLAAVLAPPPAAVAFSKPNLPDWVYSAASQTLPTYSAETNAVVLLDEIIYTVAPDGHAVEHVRRAIKILRPQGRSDAAIWVPFDKDSQILSLHVWSIGPDGHEYALKDNEIIEQGSAGGGNLYDDEKVKHATAPGSDPGGIVAYEYEQRARPYLSEETWSFQDDLPRRIQSFTLQLPPGFSYHTVWAHSHNDPGQQTQAIDLERQRLRWERNDTPAIEVRHVPMHPSVYALASRMTVHYAPPGQNDSASWQGIGLWYQQIAKDRLVATPEIAAKAQELIGAKTDFYDKSEAIGEFVQKQIRYFAIELRIGGWQPHPAADIFRKRFGDCKDKATLLSAMLSTVGVHSALMMVDDRRGVVDPDAPSIIGNHMVSAIEIPAGYISPKLRSVVTSAKGRRYLVFDPTWEKTPFGQLEHQLQGGYGVLFEGDQSQIIALPVLSPQLNTVHRSGSFLLQPDGGLKGTVTEKRFGDVSEYRRYLYSYKDAKEQQQFLDQVLRQDFTSFTVSGLKVENLQALNQALTLTYDISADHFGKNMGPLLMLRPRVLGSEYLPADQKPRMIPIDLDQTMQSSDAYDIQIPPGYAVDEMPVPVKLDLGFAAYESSSTLTGNTIHYVRTYTVREVSLPASRYGDVQKLARVIGADEHSHAVLTRR